MITEDVVREEEVADPLLAEAQALADKPALTEGTTPEQSESNPTPPVNLPGGPKTEPKSNASAIDRMAELFGAEYDFGKSTQFALQSAIVKAVGEIQTLQRTKENPKQAVVVAAVAELRRRFKVSYATIAGLILEGVTTSTKNTLVLNHPDSKLPDKVVKPGKPPERQFATRYVRLADWTNARFTGNWKKGDNPTQFVTIMGKDYLTPVDALLDGHSMTRVDIAWAWKVRQTPRSDMRGLVTQDQVDAKYAMGLVKGLSVPIRVNDTDTTDEKGNPLAQKRSSVKVIGHPAATAGTIIGILLESTQLGIKLTEDECNTIIELTELLAPEPKPEQPDTQPAE